MKSLLLGFVCVLGLAAASDAAAADPQLAAPIQQFLDSFNKGDVKGAAAAHAGDLAIIDEVSPYIWRGPGAFEAWAGDLARYSEAHGVTDQSVVLSAATREEVQGDRAYVIAPAVYSFKQRGVAMRETAQMTFALKKEAADWKIAGWAWTGGKPQAVR